MVKTLYAKTLLCYDLRMNKKAFFRGIQLYAIGFCMGTVDLIPGVSGGTVAFVSGIYEELLKSINIVTGQVPGLVFKGKPRQAFDIIPFRFLLPIALGMGSAIFSLAHALSWILERASQQVWGFFFGLVLASTIIVMKRVTPWNARYVIAFLISMIVSFFLVSLSSVETPFTWWMVFLSGFIAICAMILPGISGSFILLLLGKYRQILEAVVNRDFMTLFIFTLGCILGISVFARFLSWLFKHYHNISVAILAGIMLGTIRKIWPWQFQERLMFPQQLDSGVILTIVLIILGFAVVFGLDRLQFLKERSQDLA